MKAVVNQILSLMKLLVPGVLVWQETKINEQSSHTLEVIGDRKCVYLRIVNIGQKWVRLNDGDTLYPGQEMFVGSRGGGDTLDVRFRLDFIDDPNNDLAPSVNNVTVYAGGMVLVQKLNRKPYNQ